MGTYGRHPSGWDSGWGVCVAGAMRGSNMGQTTYPAWATAFGVRAGKPTSGSANATGDVAIYSVSGSSADALVGEMSGTITISAVMADRTGGADYVKAPAAPIKRFANTSYVLALRSGANTINFGQDNSGHIMHKRAGGASGAFPDPYGANSADPEGKMSLWAIETPNTAPLEPTNVSPADGGSVATGNPVIAADFRDNEEVLPGFSLGQGDQLKKFRVLILDSGKTTILKDSGLVDSDSTMRSNRRSTWTVPSTALSSGLYVVQLTHYDQFDAPSQIAEWTFTVNTSSLDVALLAADVAIASPLRTNNTYPSAELTWHHDSATAMTDAEFRIRQQDTDTVVRAAYGSSFALADGATGATSGVFLFLAAGWSELTRGKTYRFEVRGQTGSSDWSGWCPSPWFIVNAPPDMPTDLSPGAGIAFTSLPILSAIFSDPDNSASNLATEFAVRTGGSGSGTVTAASPLYLGDDRWGVQAGSGEFTGLGNWEWRTRATDPAGSAGSWSAWTAVTYTTAPDITFTNPATATDILATGTPTLTWTVDRTQSSFRLRLYEYNPLLWALLSLLGGNPAADATIVHDSGVVSSGTGSHAVPAGKLRNTRDYTIVLEVTTSDGLTSREVSGFTLTYTPRGSVVGLTATLTSGDFEPAGQESEVTLDWESIPAATSALLVLPLDGDLAGEDGGGAMTATGTGAVRFVDDGGASGPALTLDSVMAYASDADFGGNLVRRTDNGTGTEEALAVLPARSESVYIDRTPQHGVSYTYEVVYLYAENLEQVESAPATDTADVTLENTVISDMAVGGGSVPIRFWGQRDSRHIGDAETIETFGPKPVSFRGLLDYQQVSIDYELLDDQVAGMFTAQDVIAALRSLNTPDSDNDGYPVAKNLCYRDPKGRVLYGTITRLEEKDARHPSRAAGRLEFTEHDPGGAS